MEGSKLGYGQVLSTTLSSRPCVKLQRRQRRHKLQIYHDILLAIRQEAMTESGARPTRIQHLANLSYDKLSRYMDELREQGMIVRGNSLSLTEKGQGFLSDYKGIQNLVEMMGLE